MAAKICKRAADAVTLQARRRFLASLAAAAAAPLLPDVARGATPTPIMRVIPGTGERLPVIGLGTWITFNVAPNVTNEAPLLPVMQTFFATVALSHNIERSCRAAMGALSNYGERLREPVEAMFYRIHAQGRANESPYCSWPRKFAMAPRLQ